MSFRITQEKISQAGAEAHAYVTVPAHAYDPGRGGQADSWLSKLRAMFGFGKTEKPAVIVTAGPGDGGMRCILLAYCPPWKDGKQGEPEALSQCYRDLLLTAKQKGCQSIALPLISSSEFGFPKDLAMRTARDEITAFLKENDLDVILCVSDRDEIVFPEIVQEDLEEYIGTRPYGFGMPLASEKKESSHAHKHPLEAARSERPGGAGRTFGAREPKAKREYVKNPHTSVYYDASPMFDMLADSDASEDFLQDIIDHTEETFQQCLLHKIDEKGLTDPDVYKRANIDRKHFSKIRSNTYYNPTKKTALALAISLGLNLKETQDLLERAGLALSPSSKADLIVKYCIMHRIYNIFEVNALLFKYGQQTLG